jgi:hypothetical protein
MLVDANAVGPLKLEAHDIRIDSRLQHEVVLYLTLVPVEDHRDARVQLLVRAPRVVGYSCATLVSRGGAKKERRGHQRWHEPAGKVKHASLLGLHAFM